MPNVVPGRALGTYPICLSVLQHYLLEAGLEDQAPTEG